MRDRTDRHFRFLMRQISRHTLLYTEMVTAIAVVRGARAKLLDFDASEHPVSLQLGGDDPALLTEAARIGEQWGYDEINLNVGCPSDRVQSGNFGACLMLQPERVAECVAAMRDAVSVEVTVKHRIGVDDVDRYEDMLRFVDVVAAAGARRFSVHARKAWLSGLSPKENRTVPPLRYDEVHRLARERPQLDVEINGGIKTLPEIETQLASVDAVMIGRAAYDRPYGLFSPIDAQFFGDPRAPSTRAEVVETFGAYAARRLAAGHRPVPVLRHLLNLYAGEPGNKSFKRRVDAVCRGLRHGAPPSATELVGRLGEAVQAVERERETFEARRTEARAAAVP